MRRIAIALVLALGVPASAQARVHTIAPPGNSGVGQYLETVPTAGGAQPTNTVHPVVGGVGGSGGPPGSSTGGTGGTAGSAGTISPSTRRALTRHGPTGAAAAALAQATAPTSASRGDHGATSGASGGSSPASSVLKTLTGSNSGSGLGPVLPSLLIVSLFGAAVMALVRRRRTS
jgi:hypothetical protein